MDFRKIVKKRVLSLSVYQIAILIALIAMLFFFSDSSLLKRIKYENEIRDLKAQIEYYRNQTETDKAKLNELQSNLENLEKNARENYLMKKVAGSRFESLTTEVSQRKNDPYSAVKDILAEILKWFFINGKT